MREIWTVCVKTSLISVRRRFGEQAEYAFFDSFEKARDAFRGITKKLAFSEDTRFENAMFNKKGQIAELDAYIAAHKDPPENDCDENYLSKKILTAIQDALIAAMSGQNVALGIKDGTYSDGQIQVDIKDGFVVLEEADEVRYKFGIPLPLIKTNMFSMEKEQNYYLFIMDQFDPDKGPDEVWLYLEKDELK